MFLEKRRERLLAALEEHRTQGTWWFVQVITNEVIDFVRRHPEVSTGVRAGSVVYETKIPYMTAEALAATDDRMKRYYSCHCPWVREALLTEDVRISPTFCNCSSAFHKKTWEAVLGRPLRADVVQSILQGDPQCTFAIHLPPDVL
mgnify:CR=1 FL=1